MTLTTANQTRQPVLFIPHGAGPCFFMDWSPSTTWHNMADFLKGIAGSLPARPKAILIVSAHWLENGFSVTASHQPGLIFDYYGFPEHTYQLEYPAAGSPELAGQVHRLLSEAGLNSHQDPGRGFDHGMFIPLKLMFPEADIPVVQLSLRRDLDPRAHVAAGQALAALRDQGVLIVGSGMSFHNMRGYGDGRFTGPSEDFDDWLTQAAEAAPEQRNERLSHWPEAPHAYHCHPAGHEEHLIPLMLIAGAAGDDRGRKTYSEQVMKTQLSAWQFG